MVTVRRQLAAGRASDAIALMDDEERVGSIDADGAWRSLRLQALRAADRIDLATAECEAWRLAAAGDHPDRALADAEMALHQALCGEAEQARALAEPWLGRSLSPLPASRLRLAEALLRSGAGDHAVAAAAIESAVRLDHSLDGRSAMGDALLFAVGAELADAAAIAQVLEPAAQLHERAIALAGTAPARLPLLERYSTICRSDAIDTIDRARSGAATIDVERVNRRLLAAAEAASTVARELAADSRGDAPARRAAALSTAAECWERVGLGDRAVTTWRAWLLERADSDPFRAEVLARVAETLHGLGRFGESHDAWHALLKAHPNSPQAARASLAAARSLRAMGRDGDAAMLLDEILAGRGGIDPESPVFVQALIERGRVAQALDDAPTARRRLEEARQRDPAHGLELDVLLLLADAWRREAIDLAALVDLPAAPSETRRMREACEAAWNGARLRFAEAVERIDARDPAPDDRLAAECSAAARLGLASALDALGRLDEARLAYEETDRRHPELEAALVALDRLSRLPGSDVGAIRRRAERRIEALDDAVRLMDASSWRLWFAPEGERSPSTLAAGAPR